MTNFDDGEDCAERGTGDEDEEEGSVELRMAFGVEDGKKDETDTADE